VAASRDIQTIYLSQRNLVEREREGSRRLLLCLVLLLASAFIVRMLDVLKAAGSSTDVKAWEGVAENQLKIKSQLRVT
jgi:hypothetical protein